MSRNINDNPFLFLAYASDREKVRQIIINNPLEIAIDLIVQMIADASYNN